MIVRISGEGQYDLPDEDEARLNELDDRVDQLVVRQPVGRPS
jgi:hypothetical protein